MFINQINTVMGPALQYGMKPLVITQMGNQLEIHTLIYQEEWKNPQVWNKMLAKAPSNQLTLEALGLTSEAQPTEVMKALLDHLT